MDYSAIIKEIGRGKNHARDLDPLQAQDLFSAMLNGTVPPLELGAILLALRMKGEAETEMQGFYQAIQRCLPHLVEPAGAYLPVVIPSYNGARKQPNLTPLLVLLLSRAGIPVLVHGVSQEPGRITTIEILNALGYLPSTDVANICWQTHHPVIVPITRLLPALASLLDMRWRLGVRTSAHTLVKMLSPFRGSSLRIASVSHPAYIQRMAALFNREQARVLLLHGSEGEPYANPLRCPSIYLCQHGAMSTVVEREQWQPDADLDLPDGRDLAATVHWTEACLQGKQAIPASIQLQLVACIQAARQ